MSLFLFCVLKFYIFIQILKQTVLGQIGHDLHVTAQESIALQSRVNIVEKLVRLYFRQYRFFTENIINFKYNFIRQNLIELFYPSS